MTIPLTTTAPMIIAAINNALFLLLGGATAVTRALLGTDDTRAVLCMGVTCAAAVGTGVTRAAFCTGAAYGFALCAGC